LIGIGISHLAQSQGSELQELDVKRLSLSKAEAAMDKIRAKFGSAAVDKGIGLKRKKS
jgi:DNA polymerase IV